MRVVFGGVLRRAGRLVGAKSPWWPGLGEGGEGVRGVCASRRVAYADLQVSVPPLGESITDGAIAAIMKQPGDSVEEDETLLSIETDKVTVDVRTPVSGVVKSILVSPDESVEVGRVVAVVSAGEARGTVESEPERAVEERRETATEVASTAGVVLEEEVMAAGRNMERVFGSPAAAALNHGVTGSGSGRAHVPSITFPTRRTADGRVISELPEADQKRIRSEELSALHSVSFFMRNAEGGGRGGGARAPPLWRRPMSDKEMESIMLGGAE